MSEQPTLPGVPLPAAPVPSHSEPRNLTHRQFEHLAVGQHPLSVVLSRPLRLHAEAAPYDDRDADGRRCGNCQFRQSASGHSGKSFPKCTKGDGARITHGNATDCRAWWPGCVDHERKEP